MAVVALAADVLIGFLNRDDAHHARARREIASALSSGSRLVVAASAYSESLVGPIRAGRQAEADEFFRALAIEIVPIGAPEAREAAALRGAHPALRLPDAFVAAVARLHDARLLTFDGQLARVAGRHPG
jgi:predicted nucleic acid-binding protein